MKIILINTDPMVAKLIEATAKKTGIMLASYVSTDELDVSTLTKEHFVFIDESALGTDKDRIKSIAQEHLSCLLYAKTKPLKDFPYLVKKPFLPTEILDILQAELLKVGQDLHNASEVTKDEIAQVDTQADGGAKMPDIDMGMLDKLGDFDITQEFDAHSPIPPLESSPDKAPETPLSDDLADTQELAAQESLESGEIQASDEVGDIADIAQESSTLDEPQDGLGDSLDDSLNFLEESDMQDLDSSAGDLGDLDEIKAQETKPQETQDSLESMDSTDPLAIADGALDELGDQELESFGEQAASPETQDATQEPEAESKESIEFGDLDIAPDIPDAEIAPDAVETSAQESAAQSEIQESQTQELEALDSSSVQDDVQSQSDESISSEALDGDIGELDSQDVDSSGIDTALEDLQQENPKSAEAMLEELDSTQTQEQETEEIVQDAMGPADSSEIDSSEIEASEVLPQDEIELVKNLLEPEHTPSEPESLESAQELESSEIDSSADTASDDGASEQEFADISLEDLAQVETDPSELEEESSAQAESSTPENAATKDSATALSESEDYLQLSESEICQALGETPLESSEIAEPSVDSIDMELESPASQAELESQPESIEELESTQELGSIEAEQDEIVPDLQAELESKEIERADEDEPDLQEKIEEEINEEIEAKNIEEISEEATKEAQEEFQEYQFKEDQFEEEQLKEEFKEAGEEASEMAQDDSQQEIAQEDSKKGPEWELDTAYDEESKEMGAALEELEAPSESPQAPMSSEQELEPLESTIALDSKESQEESKEEFKDEFQEELKEESKESPDTQESLDTLDTMVAHDLQELEEQLEEESPAPDQSTLQDLGEFGTGLQAINALRDEMQSLGDLDPFAGSEIGGSCLQGAQEDHSSPASSSTQANQTQAQLFSELLANKSAQEIRSLLNGAQISINISFSDKI